MINAKQKVIAIFDCDEWKSTDSLRLIMISDEEHLKENLKKIKKDHEYSKEDMETYIYMEELHINELY